MVTKYPMTYAHRGSSTLWVENSITAFRNALHLGARGIEFDVHLTRDLEPVVIHDATLDRTTDGRGPICQYNWAEIRRLQLLGSPGEHIPHLDDVLELLGPLTVRIIVEAKKRNDGGRYYELGEILVRRLGTAAWLERSLVTAFDWEYLTHTRDLCSQLPLCGVIAASQCKDLSDLDRAAQNLATFGATAMGVEWTILDATAVQCVRNCGLSLGAWTVNDVMTMRHVASLGVDWMISDRADLLVVAFPEVSTDGGGTVRASSAASRFLGGISND